jgi:hypothetical protein
MNGGGQDNVTMKFHISDTEVVAHHFPAACSIAAIKHEIGKKFRIDPMYLSMRQGGQTVEDGSRLGEIDMNKFGIVDVELAVSDLGMRNGIVLDTSAYYR